MVYSLALEFGKLSNLIVWVLTQSIHKGKIKTCVIIIDNTTKKPESIKPVNVTITRAGMLIALFTFFPVTNTIIAPVCWLWVST